MDYDRLLDFCTTLKQRELVRAVDACHGNVANACRMLGWEGAGPFTGACSGQVKGTGCWAAMRPFEIAGYLMGGHSHRGPDGEIKNTWERQSPGEEAREAVLDSGRHTGRPTYPAPADDKLLNMFTLTIAMSA